MRHPLLLAATAVLSVVALSACSVGRAESAGPSVSRNYQVGAFTGLEVAGPFDVKVTTGQAVSVAATGPQKLLDETEVVVKDGKLLIRPKKKNWRAGMNWSSRDTSRFTITVPALDQAAVAGSGDIDIDRVAGERFKGSIAGSGNLRLTQLAVQDLGLSIAGSGEITAAGQAQRARYNIAGSGDLDASSVRTVDAEARIAGSGNIQAQATGTARANIAGSGDIAITGGARCETRKNGSGDIRCS